MRPPVVSRAVAVSWQSFTVPILDPGFPANRAAAWPSCDPYPLPIRANDILRVSNVAHHELMRLLVAVALELCLGLTRLQSLRRTLQDILKHSSSSSSGEPAKVTQNTKPSLQRAEAVALQVHPSAGTNNR
jgi:hypothetical protein